jgi:hypothetical protein
MVVTAAVFQLPMFWLNADAERNTCRLSAEPTPRSPHRSAQRRARRPRHATPHRHTSRCSIPRYSTWCLIAQPRCNTPPCHIHINNTQESLTVEPNPSHICAATRHAHDMPTSAPGLAHIRGGPSPHLRRGPLAAGTTAARRTPVGRRMRATAQGRVRRTWSSRQRCSSCRCSG